MKTLSVSMCICLLLTPCLARAFCEDDSQMEVVCSETTLSLQYGDHTSGCAINPSTDVDTFVFDGYAGDTARVVCSGISVDFDCRIQVWSPNAEKIADVACSASSMVPCSTFVDVPLASTGMYSVTISDSDNNTTGNYALNLEKLPPDDAQNVYYDAPEECQLAPISDIDKFDFPAVAGTWIRLVLYDVYGGGLDFHPCLEVWDPQGTKIASGCCSGSSMATDIVLPATGKYSVSIYDTGYNNEGTYSLQLECLAGDCAAVCYYDVGIRVFENDIELTGENAEILVEGEGVEPIPTHWNDVYDGYFLCCLFCDIVWTAKARKTGDTVWYTMPIPQVSDYLTSYVEIHIDDMVPIWPASAQGASQEKPLLGRRNPQTVLAYIVPALFLIAFWKWLNRSGRKKRIS